MVIAIKVVIVSRMNVFNREVNQGAYHWHCGRLDAHTKEV